jgi:hypothetical protein
VFRAFAGVVFDVPGNPERGGAGGSPGSGQAEGWNRKFTPANPEGAPGSGTVVDEGRRRTMSRSKERPMGTPEPARTEANLRAALAAGEARRREYLATLDPRQREDLAMGD